MQVAGSVSPSSWNWSRGPRVPFRRANSRPLSRLEGRDGSERPPAALLLDEFSTQHDASLLGGQEQVTLISSKSLVCPRLTMRISRGMQSLGSTGRTARREWASRNPWSSLGSAKLCCRQGVHARPAPPRTEPTTPPGRAGRLPLPGARDHEVVWLSSPRVTHTPQRGSRVRPVHDDSGRLERSTGASANRRAAGVRTGTAHFPAPDIALRERGIESVISRSRAPSSDPPMRPLPRTSRIVSLAPRIRVVKASI